MSETPGTSGREEVVQYVCKNKNSALQAVAKPPCLSGFLVYLEILCTSMLNTLKCSESFWKCLRPPWVLSWAASQMEIIYWSRKHYAAEHRVDFNTIYCEKLAFLVNILSKGSPKCMYKKILVIIFMLLATFSHALFWLGFKQAN